LGPCASRLSSSLHSQFSKIKPATTREPFDAKIVSSASSPCGGGLFGLA
jgi:hypothetical protein